MTLSTEGLKVGAAYPNVVAFLRVIRERESGQGPDAYLMVNGGGRMDGFQKHPWENVPTTKGARACGAYQFLGTTWGGLCRQYEFADFGPESQDLGAIALIQERGALQDVIAGRFEVAVGKLRSVWTSLPGASESSASWTMDKARSVFLKYGGKLDNADLIQPAAPVEDHSPATLPPVQPPENRMPLPVLALISAFGPLLSSLIPSIAKAFDRTTDTPAKLEAATKIIETVVAATNSTNVQEAVEKMQTDPAVLTVARNAVVTEPAIQALLEIGGGIEAARAANLEMQQAPRSFLYNPAFWITILLLMFPIMLMVDVFWVHASEYNAELRTQIVTSILGVILVISGYWLGTSAGSVRKTDIIAQQGASK
jgi:muramidase (phage lysozyme)